MAVIKVDENDPIGELEPSFPFRDVKILHNVDVRDYYDLKEEIGRGKFGTVYRCVEKKTGTVLAAKFVPISKKQDRINVEREVEIMRTLQHPRLIQLYDSFEIHNVMCVVLELIEGGELFERVIDDDFILTEKACSVFMRQICEGVSFIHANQVIHLDLKPENILCLTKTGNRIKIIDFGLARKYDPNKKLQVLFGTPEFVAPEVVNFDEITVATDMWSVGVICYVLLSGLSPFMGENDVETMTNVTMAQYDFDDEAFDTISADAKDFISNLLVKNKEKRMKADECINHSWLMRKPPPPNMYLEESKENLKTYVDTSHSSSPFLLSESFSNGSISSIELIPSAPEIPKPKAGSPDRTLELFELAPEAPIPLDEQVKDDNEDEALKLKNEINLGKLVKPDIIIESESPEEVKEMPPPMTLTFPDFRYENKERLPRKLMKTDSFKGLPRKFSITFASSSRELPRRSSLTRADKAKNEIKRENFVTFIGPREIKPIDPLTPELRMAVEELTSFIKLNMEESTSFKSGKVSQKNDNFSLLGSKNIDSSMKKCINTSESLKEETNSQIDTKTESFSATAASTKSATKTSASTKSALKTAKNTSTTAASMNASSRKSALTTTASTSNALATTASTSNALATVASKSNALATVASTNNALATVASTNNALATVASTNNALATVASTNNALATVASTNNALASVTSTTTIATLKTSVAIASTTAAETIAAPTESTLPNTPSMATPTMAVAVTSNDLSTASSASNVSATVSLTSDLLETVASTSNALTTAAATTLASITNVSASAAAITTSSISTASTIKSPLPTTALITSTTTATSITSASTATKTAIGSIKSISAPVNSPKSGLITSASKTSAFKSGLTTGVSVVSASTTSTGPKTVLATDVSTTAASTTSTASKTALSTDISTTVASKNIALTKSNLTTGVSTVAASTTSAAPKTVLATDVSAIATSTSSTVPKTILPTDISTIATSTTSTSSNTVLATDVSITDASTTSTATKTVLATDASTSRSTTTVLDSEKKDMANRIENVMPTPQQIELKSDDSTSVKSQERVKKKNDIPLFLRPAEFIKTANIAKDSQASYRSLESKILETVNMVDKKIKGILDKKTKEDTVSMSVQSKEILNTSISSSFELKETNQSSYRNQGFTESVFKRQSSKTGLFKMNSLETDVISTKLNPTDNVNKSWFTSSIRHDLTLPRKFNLGVQNLESNNKIKDTSSPSPSDINRTRASSLDPSSSTNSSLGTHDQSFHSRFLKNSQINTTRCSSEAPISKYEEFKNKYSNYKDLASDTDKLLKRTFIERTSPGKREKVTDDPKPLGRTDVAENIPKSSSSSKTTSSSQSSSSSSTSTVITRQKFKLTEQQRDSYNKFDSLNRLSKTCYSNIAGIKESLNLKNSQISKQSTKTETKPKQNPKEKNTPSSQKSVG